jgi:hypothetical protein
MIKMEKLKMPRIVKVTESITYDVSDSMIKGIHNLTPRKVYFVRFAGPHGDDRCWIQVNEKDYNLAKQIMKK